jgi:hypothetical protein
MAVDLVPDTFSGRVGDTFSAAPTFAGQPLELVLSACDVQDAVTPQGVTPFSLLFHAATQEPPPQQIFELSHSDLGELALFLVPLGPDEHGMRYEAIVS